MEMWYLHIVAALILTFAQQTRSECKQTRFYPTAYSVVRPLDSETKVNELDTCKECCAQAKIDHPSSTYTRLSIEQPRLTSKGRVYQTFDCNCKELHRCTNPSGDDCNWYTSCLDWFSGERNSASGYGRNYGFKYCKKYSYASRYFTPQGQQWIDNTRQCLQKALLPYLGKPLTASQIREKAFQSHTKCYVDSGVCELGISDWTEIVNTVGDAFLSEFLKTTGNALTTGSECAKRISNAKVDNFKSFISNGLQQWENKIKAGIPLFG